MRRIDRDIEFEYQRKGTRNVFAAFNVQTGHVLVWVTPERTIPYVLSFLDRLVGFYCRGPKPPEVLALCAPNLAPPGDVVERALAVGLVEAAVAGRFDVVAQLARELEARRLERLGDAVAPKPGLASG